MIECTNIKSKNIIPEHIAIRIKRILKSMIMFGFIIETSKFENIGSNNVDVNIAGINPAELIFNGRCDDSPYICYPSVFFDNL